MSESLHVLTGAPGTGKTALLSALGPDVHWVPEPAREVLASLRVAGRMEQPDPEVFVPLLLASSIEKYRDAQTVDGSILFDRGVPDCIAYALHLGVDPKASISAAATFRYHPEVLLMTPWEDIYTTDDERTMTFDMTVQFHDRLLVAYGMADYRLVEVPIASMEKRADFVRSRFGMV